ncbi:MAG: hypothetical protein ACK4Z5_00340 [Brevundimonas sp.]
MGDQAVHAIRRHHVFAGRYVNPTDAQAKIQALGFAAHHCAMRPQRNLRFHQAATGVDRTNLLDAGRTGKTKGAPACTFPV